MKHRPLREDNLRKCLREGFPRVNESMQNGKGSDEISYRSNMTHTEVLSHQLKVRRPMLTLAAYYLHAHFLQALAAICVR